MGLLLTLLVGCVSPRYAKVAPDKAESIVSRVSSSGGDYQAIYSGNIEMDGLKLSVRLLVAFYRDNARFELVPSSGAVSIFSMARRANEGEILLPSVAKGEHLADIRSFLTKKVRTANFIQYLPALFLQKLPLGSEASSELLVCDDNRCRLGGSGPEVFEIDPSSSTLLSAVFRDRFQLTDRVVINFKSDVVDIAIPEVSVRLNLSLTKREPLLAPSSKRFKLVVPEGFSGL